MVLRAYLPKFMTTFCGGFFVAAGIFTFGNALIFDRPFLGVILFIAFLCRQDVNVLKSNRNNIFSTYCRRVGLVVFAKWSSNKNIYLPD